MMRRIRIQCTMHSLALQGAREIGSKVPPPCAPPAVGSILAQPSAPTCSSTLEAKTTASLGGENIPPSHATPTDGSATATHAVAPVDVDDAVRWIQPPFVDPATLPIVDEKGEYIVSRAQWPKGDVAYKTPPPPDTSISPRFGYNIVQVKKPQSYWQFYQASPHFSFRFLNIQFAFLILTAYLIAFLVDEYNRTMDRMKTPGAMAGEHRGKGPVNYQTQKITFSTDEITALAGNAQANWVAGKNEDSYIGSKNYMMKKISRPTEMNYDNLRKR